MHDDYDLRQEQLNKASILSTKKFLEGLLEMFSAHVVLVFVASAFNQQVRCCRCCCALLIIRLANLIVTIIYWKHLCSVLDQCAVKRLFVCLFLCTVLQILVIVLTPQYVCLSVSMSVCMSVSVCACVLLVRGTGALVIAAVCACVL